MDATGNFNPASYGPQHVGSPLAHFGGPSVPGHGGCPLVQNFRTVGDFVVAFTAYAASRYLLTPSDVPDGLSLGATFSLSPSALAGLPVNLWRPS